MSIIPNNPYGNPYLPNNYVGNLMQSISGQQPPQMVIQKISGGEESARSFPMGPNSSVILLDENKPLIWVVITDASGYKTIQPYDIAPHEEVKQEDLRQMLTKVIDRLDKLEERMSKYGQSNYGTSWRNRNGNANNKPIVRDGSDGQRSNGGGSENCSE